MSSMISRSPIRWIFEEVFNYVSNLVHSTELQNWLTEIRQITERPLGVGTQFAFVQTFQGRDVEANLKVLKNMLESQAVRA